MHMFAKLCTLNCDELRIYHADLFNNADGTVVIERIYIKEASELILRSRKIMLAFSEAQEFEKKFLRLRRKIPASFFFRI